MGFKRVDSTEANALLGQGYEYVDVRSIPEFEAGHPGGACNIPLMHFLPGRGMTPNHDFIDVFSRRYAKDAKVVVGCKTSGRSGRAAEILTGMGWTDVILMVGGFDGERDAFGRVVAKGWRDAGLPVEKEAPGRTYEELSRKP